MATWKKVLVSGSDAALNSLKVSTTVTASAITATSGFTGSLKGVAETASFVLNAETASYVQTAQTASYLDISSFTASQADTSYTASYVQTAQTASYVATAQTASFVTGSNVKGIVADAYTASYVESAQTASYVNLARTASYVETANTASWVSGSNVKGTVDSAFTASYVVTAQTASHVLASNINGTASQAYTASYVQTAQTASFVASASHAVNADSASWIGTVTGPVVITTNLTVSGDLAVAGTASFQNTTNLNVVDQFILLSSGSAQLQDSGLIVANGSNSGVALYLETASTGGKGRWAVAGDVASSATAATPDEFVVTAEKSSAAPTNPAYGGSTSGYGNIHIDDSTGDIYIYS